MNWTHIFNEHGNGFPGVGDVVVEDTDDGNIRLLYVQEVSPIHTLQFHPNYVYLVCEEGDDVWDDLSEEEQDDLWENGFHVEPTEFDEV